MRAIVQNSYGGADVLETVEVPCPEPGPGEVLVRVAAAGVNPADWKLRSGQVHRFDLPITLGFDVSGIVVGIGADVTGFTLGDEVFGLVLGTRGSYAEYVAVAAAALAPKPAVLDHISAAALPTAALTAWQGLAELRAGQRILIHAAAGGVGHLAVQIAAERGARIVATARAVNHDYLHSLGANDVIDYTAVDFVDTTGTVDVVLDLVGGAYGQRSLRVLTPEGRYIDALGSDAESDPRYVRLHVQPSGTDLAEVVRLVEKDRLRVTVDRVLSLADAAEAHRISESGRVRGKIVLLPWSEDH